MPTPVQRIDADLRATLAQIDAAVTDKRIDDELRLRERFDVLLGRRFEEQSRVTA